MVGVPCCAKCTVIVDRSWTTWSGTDSGPPRPARCNLHFWATQVDRSSDHHLQPARPRASPIGFQHALVKYFFKKVMRNPDVSGDKIDQILENWTNTTSGHSTVIQPFDTLWAVLSNGMESNIINFAAHASKLRIENECKMRFWQGGMLSTYIFQIFHLINFMFLFTWSSMWRFYKGAKVWMQLLNEEACFLEFKTTNGDKSFWWKPGRDFGVTDGAFSSS